MSDAMNRVQSRIRQIESLLGGADMTKGTFGAALDAARQADGSKGESRAPAEAAAPEALHPLIEAAATRTGLGSDLLSAVIGAESGFRPNAVSRAGAQGLMQLMPGTARALGVTDPMDPMQNLIGGATYLSQQLTRFGTLDKALAAYNAGPGAVERYGGVPPYPETRDYVQRVLNTLSRLTAARSTGTSIEE